jgi:hypothetical protein
MLISLFLDAVSSGGVTVVSYFSQLRCSGLALTRKSEAELSSQATRPGARISAESESP